MKHYNKKLLARMLCLFFVFSAFGGGLLSSGKWLGGGQSYATEAPLTEAEHEVQPEGSEIPDENVDAEGGIVDGADVDVDKETEDVDAAEVGEEEENQTKSGKRMVAFSDDGIDPQADDTGAFNVTGGTYGVDYEYKTVSYHTQGYGNAEGWSGPYVPNKSGGVYTWTQTSLVIKTSTPLTISTSGTTNAGIYIESGVQADLTFAGVKITAELPVNIVTNKTGEGVHDPVEKPTSLHLTLADGTVNTLTCLHSSGALQCPGIRCGEGSKLTIDDGRRNVDQNGQFVAPKDGKISRDATLLDGTVVKAGDRLTLLDSDNPGTLTVNGGYRSAAIGGGPIENSGDMTFNGGIINAYAYGPLEGNMGAGCGIGGGHAGGGTVITVNGGNIDATGSLHGAGFGGGCTYTGGMSSGTVTYAFTDAILCRTPSSTIAGDININGGFIKSQGFEHSNAFGKGCGGTNNGKTITITGGTLLPTSQAGWYDIGGTGGDVIVTGGSIRLSGPGKFECNGGAAYGDLNRKTRVFMTTIDLSGEKVDGHNIFNDKICDWELLIAGEKYDYGAPAVFDQGKLYLWLPDSADKKEITVKLGTVRDDGTTNPLEPLFVQSADKSGNSLLKRYVDFVLPDDYTEKLVKDYDGLAFSSFDLGSVENEGTDEKGIYTGKIDDKYLDDNSAVTYKVQRYDKKEGNPIGQEIQLGNAMPADAGNFKFTMTSSQYSNQTGFKESYWGHRAQGWAIINRIPSEIADATYDIEYDEDPDTHETIVTKMTFKAKAKQGAEKRKPTCKAPDGYVQFYVNGVKVGEPIKANQTVATETINGNSYEYGVINKEISFNTGNYPAIPKLDSGKFVVEAKYVEGYNYEESYSLVKPEEKPGTPGSSDTDEPTNFPFVNPPTPVIPSSGSDPEHPEEEPKGTVLEPGEIERIEDEGDLLRLHGKVNDKVSKRTEKDKVVKKPELVDFFNERYVFVGIDGRLLKDEKGNPLKVADVTIKDADGNEIQEIDLSEPGKYVITTTVTDAQGNKTTINLAYNVTKPIIQDLDLNKDTNDDGIPDINIDTDDDGLPDINIDTDGDDKPDINIDTDDDGKPDVDIDIDGDGKPDINKDTDGDGKPDVDIDTNGDGKPDINKDTDGDGKPDLDIDTNGDGKPDVNVDTDGDGKPDINKDTDGDGKPDLDIDTNGDGKPDVNVDTNGDGKPDINIDKDGDGKPDINIDKDGDGKPDINIDKDGDGKPDINIDKDGDGKPDINIDKDGDGKPDINIDKDGDGKPDINIDTNGDGKPDINIDIDGDGKPDINIDTDGDGIPDLNVDTDGDGKPDVNIDTDGDGKPDKNIKSPEDIKNIIKEQNPETDELPWWIPRTGDTANMLLWVAGLAAAVLALCGMVFGIRRKNGVK